MYARTPSGVVWDPVGIAAVSPQRIEDGFVLAAEDIALGLPRQDDALVSTGWVEQIWVAADTAQAGRMLDTVGLIPGAGLEGDRYTVGRGTFPSGRPGSAMTLIEAEVCESFTHTVMSQEKEKSSAAP